MTHVSEGQLLAFLFLFRIWYMLFEKILESMTSSSTDAAITATTFKSILLILLYYIGIIHLVRSPLTFLIPRYTLVWLVFWKTL